MLQRTLVRSSASLSARVSARASSVSHPSPARFIRSAPAPSVTRAIAASSARWYSDAAASPSSSQEAKQADGEKVQEEQVLNSAATNTSNGNGNGIGNAEVEKLKAELEAKKKEITNLKDAYVRSVADYRNLQDRTARDKQQAHDFALQKFARDLIPSIDNLTHALNSVPHDRLSTTTSPSDQTVSDLVNLHKGVQLMETVLLDVLKKHGMVKYDPAGEGAKFDPNVHDAVFMAPQPGREDGIVFHTQTPGYMLNGRVLRAAQVGVVKNS